MKALILASAVALAGVSAHAQEHPGNHDASAPKTTAAALKQDMRKLWTDHVVWTRTYIIAAVGDQPDAGAAATRLLKNQEDIGGAVGVYYGKAAGDNLTGLLKGHITIAVDLIKAAKAGDKSAQDAADRKWHANSDSIATFLAKANPNWPRATLVDMMNTHLSTTMDEVVARLKKDWDGDVRAYDKVYDHILKMSDALADGIVKQFPERITAR
jgi:hypothetical protein